MANFLSVQDYTHVQRWAAHDQPENAVKSVTIRSAVELFAGDVIAKMIVICAVLRTAVAGP